VVVHTRTYEDPDAAATVQGPDRNTTLDLPVLFDGSMHQRVRG
jgi:hypothetical protein